MFKRLKKKRVRREIISFLIRLAVALLVISPLLMGLSYSFRSDSEIMTTRGVTLLPREWTLENYEWVFQYVPIGRYIFNSIIQYVLIMGSQIILSSLAGYAFACFEFKGKKVLFNAILFSMMIPGEVTLIANYLQVTGMGLSNTYLGMVITSLVSSMGIFMLRQFYKSLPVELMEAARLDGCGRLRYWLRIALPLSQPTLASLALFEFVNIYNRYMWPLLMADNEDMYTIQIGMAMLKGAEGDNLGVVLAGAVVCIVPVLIVFILGQRYIVAGMVSGGVKE